HGFILQLHSFPTRRSSDLYMTDKKNQITQDEINQILWQACDTFRGILNSATYMNYLLPMLFLKYISDSFEEKYEEFEKQYKGDKDRKSTRLNSSHVKISYA